MIKIYLDDKRKFPEKELGYTSVRTYKECILLLSIYKRVDVINLDYDLGTKATGYDVLVYMKENNIIPKEIIVHSTHPFGVYDMEEYIKENFKESNYIYAPAAY